LPVWVYALVWSQCVLTYLLVKSYLQRRQQKQEMRELGAVEAPVYKGKWPGNLDFILKMLNQAHEGYP
ncbi:hypothetical protein WOLCODRAFT_37174, partial [Wolfiporia cocos MD-104 SS10]